MRKQNSGEVWYNFSHQTSTTNFQIQNQNISFCPRGAWQILANSALFAQSATSAEQSSAPNSAENAKIVKWRRVRDSNPRYPKAQHLSRVSHSTALATLRIIISNLDNNVQYPNILSYINKKSTNV